MKTDETFENPKMFVPPGTSVCSNCGANLTSPESVFIERSAFILASTFINANAKGLPKLTMLMESVAVVRSLLQ